MARSHDNTAIVLGGVLAGIALLVLYLMNKAGYLHAAVTSSIKPYPGTNVLPSDSVTGAPQFDTRNPATIPGGTDLNAIPPIDGHTGIATSSPSDPTAATCPIGYVLWKNAADGSYWCFPQ